MAEGKRGSLFPSLVAPQISVKDLSSYKWVGFRLAANQKLSRNLLHFLPPSNLALVAVLSISAKAVYTDCNWARAGLEVDAVQKQKRIDINNSHKKQRILLSIVDIRNKQQRLLKKKKAKISETKSKN